MNAKIRNALGILSSDVPTGNLVWVDQVNGVDALAVRGRLTIPFQTLNGAKAAAQSGDTIIVLPGTYNEKNLLKNGVNWHFLPGAKVIYSGAVAGAIFDTSVNGSNGLVVCSVTGYGQFENTSDTGSNHVLYCDNGFSDLTIQGRLMVAEEHVAIKVTAGKCRVQVTEDVTAHNADAMLVNSGTVTVLARDLVSDAGAAVNVAGGIVEVTARKLSATGDSALKITAGSGPITISAYELYAQSNAAVYYNSSSNPILTILNARIVSSGSGDSGNAIHVLTSSTQKIKLVSCALIAAGNNSIKAASPIDVYAIGGLVGNKALSSVTVKGNDWFNETSLS